MWGIVPLLFVVVASLGLVLPNATALALAAIPAWRAARRCLLGVLQFIVGAAAAPLVGVAGTGTAVPMATVIAVLAVGAVLLGDRPRAGRAAPGAGRCALRAITAHWWREARRAGAGSRTLRAIRSDRERSGRELPYRGAR